MSQPIKAVIFDCFGVLYHGSLSYLLELTPPEYKEEMRDLRISADYGYISNAEYLEQAAQLVDRDVHEMAAIVDARHVRHEELFKLVKVLKENYKSGILSNVGSDVMNHLFAPGELEELFDATVFSSDIGMVKPNPEIFEYAADQLGVTTNECLMIDDLKENCLGAETAGMEAVQYESYVQLTSALRNLGIVNA